MSDGTGSGAAASAGAGKAATARSVNGSNKKKRTAAIPDSAERQAKRSRNHQLPGLPGPSTGLNAHPAAVAVAAPAAVATGLTQPAGSGRGQPAGLGAPPQYDGSLLLPGGQALYEAQMLAQHAQMRGMPFPQAYAPTPYGAAAAHQQQPPINPMVMQQMAALQALQVQAAMMAAQQAQISSFITAQGGGPAYVFPPAASPVGTGVANPQAAALFYGGGMPPMASPALLPGGIATNNGDHESPSPPSNEGRRRVRVRKKKSGKAHGDGSVAPAVTTHTASNASSIDMTDTSRVRREWARRHHQFRSLSGGSLVWASYELISIVEKTAGRNDGTVGVMMDYNVGAHPTLQPVAADEVDDRFAFLRALRARSNASSTCLVFRTYLTRPESSFDPKEIFVSLMVRASDASNVDLALSFRVGDRTVAERRSSVLPRIDKDEGIVAFASVQACAFVSSVYERLLQTNSESQQDALLGRCSAVISVIQTPPVREPAGSPAPRPEIMAVAHVEFAFADEDHESGTYTVFRLW